MKINRINQLVSILLFCVLCFLCSCENFVEIDPPRNEIISAEVFSTDEGAEAAVNGIYGSFIGSANQALFDAGPELFTGLLSDELTNFSRLQDFIQFTENEVRPDENKTLLTVFWDQPYQYVFRSNAVIEALINNTLLTPSKRDLLLGEALFIRAFVYFHLVNLFGQVPHTKSTDVFENTIASKDPVSQIYENIIDDLLVAKELMTKDFSIDEQGERLRPNQSAATALLARVYLYNENWAGAALQATDLIANDQLVLEDSLNAVFIAESREVIWQLNTVDEFRNSTGLGNAFILRVFPPGFLRSFSFTQVSLSDNLINSFEVGDSRLDKWVGVFTNGSESWNYAFKYQNDRFVQNRGAEYSVILRLGEAYLIRAEANAQLGNLNEAIADLDMIRNRAQLPLIRNTSPAISQSDLLIAIYQERRVELFCEGHRWYDLKRTGRADEVLQPIKMSWQPTDVLLPIPESELRTNPNLGPQNDGY